ncbi:MAG: trypsin-like serine protease [Oscillospiraceae bacterium]|nr:trypsin-like serine protease [Oscillospiraceae bacterium]
MDMFKKVMSGILALSLCVGVGSVNVNAASTYKKGDIDGNGSITLSDAAYMNQFLHGSKSANARTVERLDVNGDYIINDYDRSLLSNMIINGSVTTLSYNNTSALPIQSSRTYYVYSPSTGVRNDVYTLNPVNNITTSGTSTMSIIDGDDRYIENGLDGVINVQYSSGSNCGTAFVIGPHTLLTAAHVVYNSTNLRFKIFTNYNTESDVQITPTAYHIPSMYVSGSDSWKYDYAIVKVSEDLSDYVNFDLGVMRNEVPLSRTVYATGFGGNCEGITSGLADVKSTGTGSFVSMSDNDAKNYVFHYNVDTVPGDSGSPVYVRNTDGSQTVIGIHTYGGNGYNQAIRITSDILHFAYNNSNL